MRNAVGMASIMFVWKQKQKVLNTTIAKPLYNIPFSASPDQVLCIAGKVTPVIFHEGVSYAYVQYSNLYLLIVARTNINAAAFLGFLHKLKEVFVHYFNELEEESLRDNFVIAYELLDEVLFLQIQNPVYRLTL